MVEIDGHPLCSAEYADQTIGGQVVERVSEHDGYLWIGFANGTAIPLTCTCCCGRLHAGTLTVEHLGRLLGGRTLEGFRHGEWVGQDADAGRHPIFALQFDGNEDPGARTIQLHLDSVQRITRIPSD